MDNSESNEYKLSHTTLGCGVEIYGEMSIPTPSDETMYNVLSSSKSTAECRENALLQLRHVPRSLMSMAWRYLEKCNDPRKLDKKLSGFITFLHPAVATLPRLRQASRLSFAFPNPKHLQPWIFLNNPPFYPWIFEKKIHFSIGFLKKNRIFASNINPYEILSKACRWVSYRMEKYYKTNAIACPWSSSSRKIHRNTGTG